MKKQEIKEYCLKTAGIAGGTYLLILILFIFLIVSPQAKKLTNLRNEIKKMKNTSEQYRQFDKVIKLCRKSEKEVTDIINNFKGYLAPVEGIEQSCLEEINKIGDHAKIVFDRIDSVKTSLKTESEYKKQTWKVDFSGSFQQIGKIFYLLENNPIFFGIQKLAIKSGLEKPEHKVNMYVYTVLISTKMQLSREMDIFTLPEITNKIAKDIKRKQDIINIPFEVEKDPLFYGDTIFPVKRQKGKNIYRPKLFLKGITWDKDKPLAIINGRVLGVGDVIKGAKIVKITETYVTYKWHSKYFKLKLKKRRKYK